MWLHGSSLTQIFVAVLQEYPSSHPPQTSALSSVQPTFQHTAAAQSAANHTLFLMSNSFHKSIRHPMAQFRARSYRNKSPFFQGMSHLMMTFAATNSMWFKFFLSARLLTYGVPAALLTYAQRLMFGQIPPIHSLCPAKLPPC